MADLPSFLSPPVKAASSADTPVQTSLRRQQNVREQFIAIEEIKVLRDAVAECYRTEGVNHYENCKEQVQAYMERTRGKFPTWDALKPA
jgi:hypothetical protein